MDTAPPIPAAAADAPPLQRHADTIRASGILGRSEMMRRLFDYLVECAVAGRVPKEIEIAIDGFGRSADFDASQDALVRVYVHKLRRKLEDYYGRPGAAADGMLAIPRGEYRVVLVDAAAGPGTADPAPPPAASAPHRSVRERWFLAAAAVLAVVCVVLLVDRFRLPRADATTRALRENALWAPLFADELPIQVVLGDYYIFGERAVPGDGADSRIARLVRDFDVNSREDLEQRREVDPDFAARYADLRLGYLPTSSAQALRAVLPILTGGGKTVTIQLASQLSPSAFKNSHVVYIGYLSGLGMMQDVVFAGSGFAIGSSYDELIDMATGTPYVSEAAGPLPESARYRDYGYLSTFAGPEGNQHLVLAGTRDTAVMQTSEIAASLRRGEELLARSGDSGAFEALYEVYGVNRTNLEARLVLARALDAAAIWGEAPEGAAGLAHVGGGGIAP